MDYDSPDDVEDVILHFNPFTFVPKKLKVRSSIGYLSFYKMSPPFGTLKISWPFSPIIYKKVIH